MAGYQSRLKLIKAGLQKLTNSERQREKEKKKKN